MTRMKIKGTAKLRVSGRADWVGPGQVSQEEDGTLRASVTLDNGADDAGMLITSGLKPDSFHLFLSDGRELLGNKWLTTNVSIRLGRDVSPETLVEGRLAEAKVFPGNRAGAARPSRYVFFLTNLQFLGTRPVATKFRTRLTRRPSRIDLGLAGRKAHLQWLPNYDRVTRELKSSRGIRVTARLHIAASGDDVEQTMLDLVEDVCTLLCLASGNHVAWIECRKYDLRGRWLSSTHFNGVKRPYVSHPVIDPNDGAELRSLVETGLGKLRDWDRRLGTETDTRPMRNAIRLGLDARTEGTYLQSRTLAALTVVELLTSKLTNKRGANLLLPSNHFRKVQKTLREALQGAKQDLSLDGAIVDRMASKLGELNRPTFDDQVRELLHEATLDPTTHRLETFRKIRNSIVHTGDYIKGIDLTPVQQHYTVLEFIDRLFLGLLGYEGTYLSALNGWQRATLKDAPQ